MGGVSAAVSKTAAAPIERVKLLIQNQVRIFSDSCGTVVLEIQLQLSFRTAKLASSRMQVAALDKVAELGTTDLERAKANRATST